MSSSPTKADFAALAQFVNYAYEITEIPIPGGPIPDLPAGFPSDYSLTAYIQAQNSFWGFNEPAYYGFVAYSAAKKQVIVAIRGTLTLYDWIYNIDATRVDFYPRTGIVSKVATASQGLVHHGFYSLLSTMSYVDADGHSLDLVQYLSGILSNHPGTTIDFVAHSLGGALTALLASSVGYFDAGVKAASTVVTFAAPAAGDPGFAMFYGTSAPTSYRIWNKYDPVPWSLPEPFYQQVPEPGVDSTPTDAQWWEYNSLDPVCNHSLQTYQWLLDSSYPLLGSCKPWIPTAAANDVELERQAGVKGQRLEMMKAARPVG